MSQTQNGGSTPKGHGTGSEDGVHIFLEGLDEAGWRLIRRHGEAQVFAPGEVLVGEGERDEAIFIIEAGSAEVVLGLVDDGDAGGWSMAGQRRGGRVIAQLPTGTVFGEIAFFDRMPRSATVRATSAGRMLRLTRDGFERLAAWEPHLGRRILLELGRILALRLRWVQSQSTVRR
ncbi:MAG: cyclic nucleotide-binding domain-containing protein [Rhizobiales bacterium]|nr:cyclic nucleotide-binding domain-containing protein [Hyphomicrobiales bacterium]